MVKTIGQVIIGFVLGILVMLGFQLFTPRAEAPAELGDIMPQAATSTPTMSHPLISDTQIIPSTSANGILTLGDQDAGNSIIITRVNAPVSGWVVVHEETNDAIGNALGAARVDVGSEENVAVELLRGTEVGRRYWVVFYTDDGDRAFSIYTDTPLTDAEGEPIMVPFRTQ